MSRAEDEPLPLPSLPEDWHRCLAVVAHPDDVEYGASAAVARWTADGKQVSYLLATRGEAGIDGLPPAESGPRREHEQRLAARAVGVSGVEFLDHPDGLLEYGVGLRRDIALAIRRHRPEVLLTLTARLRLGPSINSPDHRAVGLAVLDAARDSANRWLFADARLEPWAGVRMIAYAVSPSPTHAVDVGAHLDAAAEAVAAHQSYLRALDPDFDAPSYLREMTRDGGRRAGCEHAVTFEVVNL